jgi:hypothetical protein
MAFSKKRHLAQGTPGLVYSSSQRPGRLRRLARSIGTIISEERNAPRGLWASCRGPKRSEKLPDDQQHHDRKRYEDHLAGRPMTQQP